MQMNRCKVGEIIDVAEPAETLSFLTALNERDPNGNFVWSAKNLSRAIEKVDEGPIKDYTVGATTIKEHRNLTCVCAN